MLWQSMAIILISWIQSIALSTLTLAVGVGQLMIEIYFREKHKQKQYGIRLTQTPTKNCSSHELSFTIKHDCILRREVASCRIIAWQWPRAIEHSKHVRPPGGAPLKLGYGRSRAANGDTRTWLPFSLTATNLHWEAVLLQGPPKVKSVTCICAQLFRCWKVSLLFVYVYDHLWSILVSFHFLRLWTTWIIRAAPGSSEGLRIVQHPPWMQTNQQRLHRLKMRHWSFCGS